MLHRASIFTVFFLLLSGPGMWILLQTADAAEQHPGGVVMVDEEKPRGARYAAQRHVTASAKASASASARSGPGGCQAESFSAAEARAGEEHAFEQDQDRTSDEKGNCSARAESSAQAKTGR